MKELIVSPIYNEKGNIVGQEYHGELIRCKDCKFNPEKTTLGCPMIGSIVRNDDSFCHWAVIGEEGDVQCN